MSAETRHLSTEELYSDTPFRARSEREDLLLWLDARFKAYGSPQHAIEKFGPVVGNLIRAAHDTCELYEAEYSTHMDVDDRLVERLRTIAEECDRLLSITPWGLPSGALAELRTRVAMVLWIASCGELGEHALAEARLMHSHQAALLAFALAEPAVHYISGAFGCIRQRAVRYARRRLGIPDPEDKSEATPEPEAKTKAGKKKKVDGPSLLVLRSVDHLPKRAAERGGYGVDPRGEFEQIAGTPIPLRTVRDVAAARRVLVAEAPHHEAVIDLILGDVARAQAGVSFRPTLFVDEPGSGKSRLARRLGEVLGVSVDVYGAGGAMDSSIAGTSRQWGTARASFPLQAIRRSGSANPLIILDEIDKAGSGSQNGSLVDALVGMLERETASRFLDPFVECAVDLSRVLWIATANSMVRIPGPLLDRFRIVHLPRPDVEHASVVTRSIVADIRKERREDATWVPDLAPDELALVVKAWRDGGGSVRLLRRLVETVVDGRDALAARH